MPTILIVDDEEAVRRTLRAAVEAAGDDFSVVAEAATGEQATEQWRATRPDLVVLDQRLPDQSGFDIAKQILAQQPSQRIILFSAFLDEATACRAASIGISACITKSDFSALAVALRRHSV